jgi:hypothetical protein
MMKIQGIKSKKQLLEIGKIYEVSEETGKILIDKKVAKEFGVKSVSKAKAKK